MTTTAGYVDVEVLITTAGDGYQVVLSSIAGEQQQTIALPLTQLQADVQGLITLTRTTDPTAYDVAALWGQTLYRAVFGQAERLMGTIRGRADISKQGIRFRIRTQDAAIQALPWEYLHDGTDFFAFDPRTPVVRYPQLAQPRPTLVAAPDELPLRLLVVLANPRELPLLNLEDEWQRLYAVLEPLEDAGLMEVECLRHATTSQFRDALSSPSKRFSLLHFVGHGHFDSDTGRGSLLLEDENGGVAPLSERSLALWVKQSGRLRAIFLNACESGTSQMTNRATGMAQQLVASGVGAVIAHQFPIQDRIGIAFAQDFYKQIVAGHPVEAAVNTARTAIDLDNIAWGTPVLFLRADDGRLIDETTLSADRRALLQRAGLRRGVTTALEARTWERAVAKLEQLTQVAPEDTQAKAQYVEFRHADVLFTQVEQHIEGEDIASARTTLDGLRRLEHVRSVNYRDWETVRQKVAALTGSRDKPDPVLLGLAPPLSKSQREIQTMMTLLLDYQLVPFLGSNANRCGRAGHPWLAPGDPLAPTFQEMANYLRSKNEVGYPPDLAPTSLAFVAQYLVWERSIDLLHQELTHIFSVPQEATPLHHLLAKVASRLTHKRTDKHLILISANYDQVLEETLLAHGVAFHLLTYEPDPSGGGRFFYTPADKALPRVRVNTANEQHLPDDGFPVVIKLNGSFGTASSNRGLVTEEQFMDHAPRQDFSALLPHAVKAQLKQSHFLFLGYSLRDWQMRLTLRRMGARSQGIHSWAVLEPEVADVSIPWDKVSDALIRPLDTDLDQTVTALDAWLGTEEDL